jgi:hypothetical protein
MSLEWAGSGKQGTGELRAGAVFLNAAGGADAVRVGRFAARWNGATKRSARCRRLTRSCLGHGAGGGGLVRREERA